MDGFGASVDLVLLDEPPNHELDFLSSFFFPAGADKVLAKSIGAMSKSRRQVKGLLKGVAKLVIASSRFQPTPS